MIVWRNIPRRMWLARHMRHGSTNLAGQLWACSCGSTIYAANRPGWKP